MRERPILFSDAMLAAHQPHAAPSAPPSESDKEDAERWRAFIGLEYQVRAEWAANLSLVPVLISWVDSLRAARAKKEQP